MHRTNLIANERTASVVFDRVGIVKLFVRFAILSDGGGGGGEEALAFLVNVLGDPEQEPFHAGT